MPKRTLSSYKGARYILGKLIEDYKLKAEKDMSPPHFRNLCYAFQVLAGYFKLDFEERLEELEKFAELGGFERIKRGKK